LLRVITVVKPQTSMDALRVMLSELLKELEAVQEVDPVRAWHLSDAVCDLQYLIAKHELGEAADRPH
jgi:hypothetical protein